MDSEMEQEIFHASGVFKMSEGEAMKKSPEEIAEDFIYKGYAVKDLQSWLTDPACVARGISVLIRAERSQAPQMTGLCSEHRFGEDSKCLLCFPRKFNPPFGTVNDPHKNCDVSHPDSRDELILKQMEALNYLYYERINGLGQTVNEIVSVTAQLKAHEALTLPLPASTKKMEAMLRVCEAAKEFAELIHERQTQIHLYHPTISGSRKRLVEALEALGAQEE